MSKKPKPAEKRWYRVVRENWQTMCVKLAGEINIADLNHAELELVARNPKIHRSMYQSIDLLPDDDQHALNMLKHISEGHYNDELKTRVIQIVKLEFRDDDRLAKIIASLEGLPPRTVCGSVEAWCAAAFNSFGWQRMNQCNAKEAVLKKIEERFATAKVGAV